MLERGRVGEAQFGRQLGQRHAAGVQAVDGEVAPQLVLQRLEGGALGGQVALQRGRRPRQRLRGALQVRPLG